MRWQNIVRQSFTSLEALADFLELTVEQRRRLLKRRDFPLLLPRRLAEKMEKRTLEDPILRQFVPLLEEQREGGERDPLVESCAQRGGARLLHKYAGRQLVVTTSSCAMHCRYCFRQHYPYASASEGFEKEITLIAADPTTKEVILSGGDPLSLSDGRLEELFAAIEGINHVRMVRIHTRFPIGIPERIDKAFISMVRKRKKPLTVVLHYNHPKELDAEVVAALHSLQEAGAVLLLQAVLLRGINDSVEILEELCLRSIEARVSPYYLHQLDPVQGALHFEVTPQEGLSLVEALRDRLPGHAVPQYVQEVPHAASKLPVEYVVKNQRRHDRGV